MKLKNKYGDMTNIIEPKAKQLEALVPVYKEAFREHNVFTMPKKDIVDYLRELHRSSWQKHGGFMIAIINDKVVGGLFVSLDDKSRKGHSRWRIQHLAVRKDARGLGIGDDLIGAAEEKIRKDIKNKNITSAKVQVKVSAKEKKAMPFYKKHGYKLEGKLANHYRLREYCYILGKLIK